MLLKPMNLLILDEPTNHLDLQSKDILMDCLKAFKGTIIFVSHDRGFMEALSTKTLELSYKEIPCAEIAPNTSEPPAIRQHRLFYGNYAYYLERVLQEATGTENVSANPLRGAKPLPKTTPASERREQDKQKQALIKRLMRQEAEILKAIEELEIEKVRLEVELARPDVYSSGEKARAAKLKLDETVTALEEKTKEWESVVSSIELSQNQF
jgi:ATP-binding cassette subfamily F protein 3